MLATNADKLIITAMPARATSPHANKLYRVGNQGRPFLAFGTGGITYNVKIGDSVYGWAADHVEPCVSSMAGDRDEDTEINVSYNFLACIGNTVRVVTGDAKGALGTVTGFHGAARVMIDFPDKALAKMTPDDKFLVRCTGQGLQLLDHPDVFCYNLDPRLLARMNIRVKNGRLEVPVTAVLPACLMGSGVGTSSPTTGDYDIMTSDRGFLAENKLDRLRLGDIVAVSDHDDRWGQAFRRGAVTLGVITHADCNSGGHGPGFSVIMTSDKPRILPRLSSAANIGNYLKIGRYRN